jgi:hypothetical protein
MKKSFKTALFAATTVASLVALTTPNYASLAVFKNFTGNVDLSTDGFGDSSGLGVISASAPSGSTVIAAYLYSATQLSNTTPTSVTLNGNAIVFTQSSPNPTACCSLSSHRADVTSIVSSIINGGGGGVYNFNINEGSDNSAIDGEALVVVYSNPALGISTIGILDGSASVLGDTTSISFADPLNPLDPAFKAEMYLGINFSCCNQKSTVKVNGNLLTENAGNNDDGGQVANGSLITVGSFDDPFSAVNPSYVNDHEKYNLASFVNAGDKKITVDTFNASQDDNIFLAAFHVNGKAVVGPPPSAVPLPAGIWLFGSALAALGFGGARKRKSANQTA